MVRKVLGLLAGLVTFFVVTNLLQLLNGLIFGMPSPDVIGNMEKMKQFVAGMTAGGFVGLLLSYIVGSFAGGFVIRKISRWESILLPMIVGLLGTLAWTYNVTKIPHPMWVTILGFLCFIPFALLGHRAAASRSSSR
jgi:hypothetical protein